MERKAVYELALDYVDATFPKVPPLRKAEMAQRFASLYTGVRLPPREALAQFYAVEANGLDYRRVAAYLVSQMPLPTTARDHELHGLRAMSFLRECAGLSQDDLARLVPSGAVLPEVPPAPTAQEHLIPVESELVDHLSRSWGTAWETFSAQEKAKLVAQFRASMSLAPLSEKQQAEARGRRVADKMARLQLDLDAANDPQTGDKRKALQLQIEMLNLGDRLEADGSAKMTPLQKLTSARQELANRRVVLTREIEAERTRVAAANTEGIQK